MAKQRIVTMKPVQKGIPRGVEVCLAAVGLIGLSPILALAAIMVRLSSPGPVIFKQQRAGFKGRPFTLYKFRSMRANSEGAEVTAKGDDRITAAGRFLRKTKIDELPELWNVLKGDMSFVGPRPEVPHYVDLKSRLWKEILRVRPGITDPVTLTLRNEEELLAQADGDKERFYRDVLQPMKLEGYVKYLRARNPWSDVWIVIKTVIAIVWPTRAVNGNGGGERHGGGERGDRHARGATGKMEE